MLNELFNSLKQRFEAIRDERQTHANTATRIGEAFLALLNYVRTTAGKFLRKDQDDETNFFITFLKGVFFGHFTTGALGTGGAVTVDENGNSSAEFDYITIRKAATFRSVSILELRHIGGELGITSGAMKISRVEEQENAWRCFFDTDDGHRHVFQEMMVGDQARCQTFRLSQAGGMKTTNYYWRLVVGVGDDYVDLSKTDCDAGSGNPAVGDEVIQLGYRGDDHPERQSAIILSAVGADAPSQKFYQGIDSYNLQDRFVKEEGYDAATGIFHCNIYGDFFVGDKGAVPDNYVRYGRDGVEIAGKMEIKPGSTLADGRPVNELGTVEGNMLRNTYFGGDYESEPSDATVMMTADTPLWSDPLKHWEVTGEVSVTDYADAKSGRCAVLTEGQLSQSVELEDGAWYMLSLHASGGSLTVAMGENVRTVAIDAGRTRYDIAFQGDGNDVSFSGTCILSDIILTRGTLPVEWERSPLDPDKAKADDMANDYLRKAISEASTSILGGLVLSQIIKVGNYRLNEAGTRYEMNEETGGMSGAMNHERSPFLWCGGDMTQAIHTIDYYKRDPSYEPTVEEVEQMAKFVVTHGGRAILNDVILRGYIYALGGLFKGGLEIGQALDRFKVDASTGEVFINGASRCLDEPGFPPDPDSEKIDLFKIFFETDPDELSRITRLFLNSYLGSLSLDAQFGLEQEEGNDKVIVAARSGLQHRSSDTVTGTTEVAQLQNGEIVLSATNGTSLNAFRMGSNGSISLTINGQSLFSGNLVVDSNGFLKVQ